MVLVNSCKQNICLVGSNSYSTIDIPKILPLTHITIEFYVHHHTEYFDCAGMHTKSTKQTTLPYYLEVNISND